MYLYEYKPPTLANRMAHQRVIRQMGADVIPRDRSWEVLLLFTALTIANAVLFVRWWIA